MNGSTALRRTTALLIAGLMMLSCKAYEGIPIDTAAVEVERGDSVRTVTWDGTVTEFEVQAVHPDALVGTNERVAFSNMKSLEKKVLSDGTNFFVRYFFVPIAAVVVLGLILASTA